VYVVVVVVTCPERSVADVTSVSGFVKSTATWVNDDMIWLAHPGPLVRLCISPLSGCPCQAIVCPTIDAVGSHHATSSRVMVLVVRTVPFDGVTVIVCRTGRREWTGGAAAAT
jgi:hypothetical protein